MNNKVKTSYRWFLLGISVFAMLFAGIIYAWSILKVPFSTDFGWTANELSLNFTLTMCVFCLGGLLGGFFSKKIGVKLASFISAVLAGGGMALTGLLNGNNVIMLYLTYAVMAGFGIGIAYNVIISTVTAWFPDKKGLCTGALMMGFGASSLVLGNLADLLFKSALSRQGTYIVLGIVLFVVLGFVSIFLNRPDENVVLPQANKKTTDAKEEFEQENYTTKEMLKRFSFWRAFVLFTFAAAVGNSVISFARDLAISVGAGFGRIITGALFDLLGRRKTMAIAMIMTVIAAGTTLLSVTIGSVPLCVVGLCLTGLSYGTCPTMGTAFISTFYGQKYFGSNFSVLNCHLILTSFMATVCSNLLNTFGSYVAPFVLLLGLAVVALLLNLTIKKP